MKNINKDDLEVIKKVEYPIIKYDSNGNKTYYEDSNGYWYKYAYDSNGNKTYYETSNGYWYKYAYDTNGNETYYEDSDGDWYKSDDGVKIEYKNGRYYLDGNEARLKNDRNAKTKGC